MKRILALAACLVALAACGDSDKGGRDRPAPAREKAAPHNPDAPVRVGVILPLSGPLAFFGRLEHKAFSLAEDEINKAGGISGRPLAFVYRDTQGRPDVGAAALRELVVKEHVPLVGGGYNSDVTWAAASVAQELEVPFLVNSAAADKITEQGWTYVFRLNPPVSEYSKALGTFLKEEARGIGTVAILHDESMFGRSGADGFQRNCQAWGLSVVLREAYDSNQPDYGVLLGKVNKASPDFIYMVSYAADAVAMVRRMEAMDVWARMVGGSGGGLTLPEFARGTGPAGEFVMSDTVWTPSVPYPGAQKFFDTFFARFHEPTDYHGAEAYAAAYVMAEALTRAGSTRPDTIRDALAATNMMTVFGPVKFISYGDKARQNSVPTYLVQWQKGHLETVWPKNVATAPYVYPFPKWDAPVRAQGRKP